MQLVKWASAVRDPRAEAKTKCQNEIETEKGIQGANERIYLPITLLGLLLLLLLPAHKRFLKRWCSENEERCCMRHGYGHIPLSAR
jgi:hypothetical protein